MKFTDDDLKRLKENLSRYGIDPGIDVCNYFEYPYEIADLVARLEAAESALGTDCYANGDCTLCKVHHERYLAWRKVAGKE